jgi:hypothetical protein
MKNINHKNKRSNLEIQVFVSGDDREKKVRAPWTDRAYPRLTESVLERQKNPVSHFLKKTKNENKQMRQRCTSHYSIHILRSNLIRIQSD